MRSIDGLRFDRWVPPRIQEKNIVRCRKVQPDASRLQADEKERTAGVGLESLDRLFAITCGSVEVFVADSLVFESRPHESEKRRELRKNDGLLFLVAYRREL